MKKVENLKKKVKMKFAKIALLTLLVAVSLESGFGDPLKRRRRKQKVIRYSRSKSSVPSSSDLSSILSSSIGSSSAPSDSSVSVDSSSVESSSASSYAPSSSGPSDTFYPSSGSVDPTLPSRSRRSSGSSGFDDSSSGKLRILKKYFIKKFETPLRGTRDKKYKFSTKEK